MLDLVRSVLLLLLLGGCNRPPSTVDTPPWLSEARVLAGGALHLSGTDLARFGDAIYLAYRSAPADAPSTDATIQVVRSLDDGISFQPVLTVRAPAGRDIREPHLLVTTDKVFLHAVTRLPVESPRNELADSATIALESGDGRTWTSLNMIGVRGFSFWRALFDGTTARVAGYEDGGKSVALFSSADGRAWTRGADIFAVAAETPLETELALLTNKLLALVRLGGSDAELTGDQGRLRTRFCFADAPYTSFTCPVLDGHRFDGPVAFENHGRRFVIARKHLQGTGRKRTAIYELLRADAGLAEVKEWGLLPSAGDTAYAGAVRLSDGRWLLSWHSSDIEQDDPWSAARSAPTGVWTAALDPRLF
jgi:hypothetical protein